MGVTVKSKDFLMDLGYGGFLRLRKKVAELTGKEIGEHLMVVLHRVNVNKFITS